MKNITIVVKCSLVLYSEIKARWGREDYVMFCKRNERSGLAFFRTGICKLRGLRSRRRGE
jgi:hypothetical protein